LSQDIGGGPPARAWRDWPNLRTVGGDNLPVWFDDVNNAVQELRTQLGIPDNVISVWTSEPRRQGLFGQAWGTGHIIIRADSDAAGALDTALHELRASDGVSAIYQSTNEQNAIIAAWRERRREHSDWAKRLLSFIVQSLLPSMEKQQGLLLQAESTKQLTCVTLLNGGRNKHRVGSHETKAPTTLVEKFFKGVADRWKQIYARAKEYLPMVPEIDTYYKSRWNNPMIVQRWLQTRNWCRRQNAPLRLLGKASLC